MGRADDVIKISGHRIGSVEIEAAIAVHPAAAEAMVMGVPDELKGQSIVAHVVLRKEYENCIRDREGVSRLKKEIMQCIENSIGKFACPKEIKIVDDLPKTPTGKTVRQILKKDRPE